MPGYNLVAIYRFRADAERARERLIRENIPTVDIRVITEHDRAATAPNRSGIFDWLFARNVPEEDHAWYQSHLYGERAAVSVRVDDEMQRDRVMPILEEFDPIEENELAAEGGTAAPLSGREREEAITSRPTGGPILETGPGAPTAEPGVAAPPVGPRPVAEPGRVAEREAAAAGLREPGTAAGVREGEQVIPVVKEEVTVSKRPVERRHRIRTYMIERPVEEQVNLRDERVVVERRPASGPVDPNAMQQREFEMVERHEEPVVEKRAREVEEVVVRKEQLDRTENVRGTVRETRVEVDDKAVDSGETVEPRRPAGAPTTKPKV
jgi:stress response protein YsnF